jgi:proteasome assembly chaperone (PAC2) family protein
MTHDLTDPWLVAAWPGMGGVAQIAATFLAQKLGAKEIAVIDPAGYFDLRSIRVQEGLALPGGLPRSVFYGWKNPTGGRDLAIFIGDQQAPHDGYRFCEEMIGVARELRVSRVFTFAAMGTMIHPHAPPRVFAVASQADLLLDAKKHAVEILQEGEISGLNGVFLAAAAAHGLGGVCLLGEFPIFAASVANPKASSAVLRVFSGIAGIEVDLTELDRQATEMERALTEHLRKLQSAAEAQARAQGGEPEANAEEPGEEWRKPKPAEDLAPELKARIEALFARAHQDRTHAHELKAELDRHGVFKRYEDRFLDLFKHGG